MPYVSRGETAQDISEFREKRERFVHSKIGWWPAVALTLLGSYLRQRWTAVASARFSSKMWLRWPAVVLTHCDVHFRRGETDRYGRVGTSNREMRLLLESRISSGATLLKCGCVTLGALLVQNAVAVACCSLDAFRSAFPAGQNQQK